MCNKLCAHILFYINSRINFSPSIVLLYHVYQAGIKPQFPVTDVTGNWGFREAMIEATQLGYEGRDKGEDVVPTLISSLINHGLLSYNSLLHN